MSEHEGLRTSASFAVVVLVASIPMAVEIVTTTTLAIGSKQMSSFGAIVSWLAAIEDLAELVCLCVCCCAFYLLFLIRLISIYLEHAVL